jgi:hypothetical protein
MAERETKLGGFILDRRVTVGEILTSLTILFSVLTLTLSLYQDRAKERKEHADRVRAAAAEALARLERWHELSAYPNFDQVFVETGESLAETGDARRARDVLWKGLVRRQAEIDALIAEEKVEVVPAEVYSYNPGLHEVFNCTLRRLKTARRDAFDKLLADAQAKVARGRPQGPEQAGALAAELRAARAAYQDDLQARVGPALRAVHGILMGEIISREDDEVAERRFTAQFKCVD